MTSHEDLVPVATLPEVSASARLGSISSISSLGSPVVFSMHSLRETSKQHHESTKEQTQHSSQRSPHSHGIECMTSTSIRIDMILNDAEQRKVASHNDKGNQPSNGSNHSSENGTAETSAESEEKGNECKTAGNGMKDHDASQCLGGIG